MLIEQPRSESELENCLEYLGELFQRQAGNPSLDPSKREAALLGIVKNISDAALLNGRFIPEGQQVVERALNMCLSTLSDNGHFDVVYVAVQETREKITAVSRAITYG